MQKTADNYTVDGTWSWRVISKSLFLAGAWHIQEPFYFLRFFLRSKRTSADNIKHFHPSPPLYFVDTNIFIFIIIVGRVFFRSLSARYQDERICLFLRTKWNAATLACQQRRVPY